AIEVDHARLDEAEQFEQVMPVAPIASEPGSIEAQNGADFSSAKPCHESLEAGSGHHPAGRAAQVVIDHLDVAETSAPRLIDQFVLPALALEVGLDLCLRRLPDIHDGLALEDRCRKKISTRHHRAPPSP